MKKQISLLIIVLAIVTISTTVIVTMQNRRSHSLFHLIPTPKSHQHVTPDGEVVEHTHIYQAPEHKKTNKSKAGTTTPITNATTTTRKSQTQIAWENLDIKALKRQFQPYTIKQMHDMWWKSQIIQPAGPYYKERRLGRINKIYPPNEWLQRYMDLGFPLHNAGYYRIALQE